MVSTDTPSAPVPRDAESLGPIAILGGGQLARMTIQAASVLGIDVVVAERTSGSPAAQLARHEVVLGTDWDDPRALEELAQRAPTITLENEFVDAAILSRLEALGAQVLPTPACVGLVQDKLRQKEALATVGLPVPPFRPVHHPAEIAGIAAELGWPLMLKARRGGYDGYGNALVRDADEAEVQCAALGWPDRSLLAEAYVRFERELAAIVVRSQTRDVVVYPVVETRQDPERHVCRAVLAPAPVPPEVAREAANIARRAVEAVQGIGTFGIEMFLLADGSVAINELAPRPHNSGHYSIEACATSQFANHVRAVLSLPLGGPGLRVPAAAMVNLLGQGSPGPTREQLGAALRSPQTYVHLYGKRESRRGRKMGHVTAIAGSVDEALARAEEAAAHLPV